MGFLMYQLGETLTLAIGGLVTLIVFGSIYARFSGSWTTQKLVLRGHRIAFDPLAPHSPVNGFQLSDQVEALLQGDPKFAVIIGRPAGLINFMREGVGLARRFEFVLSKEHVVIRRDSFTTNYQHLSKLEGLSAVSVAWVRPNALKLLIIACLAAIPLSVVGGILGLLLTLGAAAYWWYTQRVVRVDLMQAGESEVSFEIHPPLMERLFGREVLSVSQDDTSRLVQIFRVLKSS